MGKCYNEMVFFYFFVIDKVIKPTMTNFLIYLFYPTLLQPIYHEKKNLHQIKLNLNGYTIFIHFR
jgi:hypothetical protein